MGRTGSIYTLNKTSCPANFLQSFCHLFHIRPAVEGRDSEVALSGWAEAAAGGDDDIGFLEHFIEDLPTGEVLWSSDPDVGGVDSAEGCESAFLGGGAEDGGVAHVVFDERCDFCLTSGRVEGLGRALSDIANAIEFRAEATVPERMESYHFARSGAAFQFLWKNGERTANACKSAILGEAAELD